METANNNLVIVLSRNYSTGLSVIRSLGAAGYTVDLLASSHKQGGSKIAAGSKYVRNHVEVISKKVKNGGDNGLLDELLKYAGKYEQKPVLFPTDDYTTSVMDLNRSVLEEHFIMPTIVGGGDGCLTHHMDKTVQVELAKQAGLLTPTEWIFSLEEKLVIPEDMIYPCFVKPIESVTGYKREMAMCSNESELKAHLKKLRKAFRHRSILVQEFLNIDHEIDLSGVCLDQEIIIPAIIRKTNVAQYERGVTLAGKVVPFEELGEIKDKVISLMKLFHYVGMFDLELNVVGDKIYFNEVNLRSGGPNFSYFMSGANLPALFVKEALGGRHTPEEAQVDGYGKSFIYEKVAWEDHLHGFMTKQELEDCIAAADIKLLYNDDDPVPGKLFLRSIRRAALKRRLKQGKRFLKHGVYTLKKKVKGVLRRFRKLGKKLKEYLLGYPQTKAENRRDPNSEVPRVLVAGRNYCSNLTMARSFGMAGYEVEVMRVFQVKPKRGDRMKQLQPDAYSNYVKAFHICIARRKSQRIVNELIRLADPNRKMLLIPTDDLVAQVSDEYMDQLSQYYLMPNINQQAGQISRLMSKGAQKKLAQEAGLPVLNSCVIKTRNGKFRIPESVTYPCFVKPNVSKNSSKSRMGRCNNKKQLRRLLKEFSQKKDIEMLVEDFIEIGKEYSLLGLSTKDGVVGPGFFVAEMGGHKERRGVAMTGRILPCEQYQELIDQLNQFVGSLNYEGLFDVDLIETTDGKMYFVELNLRYGASGYAFTQNGANLPGMFADYMLRGKPIDLNCSIDQPGKRFVSEKIMIDEYLNRFLTMPEVNTVMDEMDIHFIKDELDPRPYHHFQKFYKVATRIRNKAIRAENRELRKKQTKRAIKNAIYPPLRKIKHTLLGYPQVKPENQRDPNSEKPRVIVAGRNYCSNLTMARSIGEAGYEVEILRVFQVLPRFVSLQRHLRPEAHSKYVKAYRVCVSQRESKRIVKELIKMADPNRKMLLIPTDDLVAQVSDEYMKKLSQYYLMPNVNQTPGEISRLMSKGVQKELAREFGLPVLNSCVIRTRKGKFKIPETVSYPCFIKPNVSKNSSKSRMRRCEDEAQLKKTLESFSKHKDIEMLVEDFVEIGKEYSLLGLSTKDGVVGPGFFVAEKGGHNERRGVAMTGRILPCEQYQDLIRDLNQFVGTLNYEGLFDIDLIETTDGKMYFVELNLRYGASGHAVTRSGANLPGMFADYMLFGKPVDMNCAIDQPGKRFVSEKVMIDEYLNRFLTKSEVNAVMDEMDIHFIKDEQDPRPYKHFKKFYLQASMMKVYYKLKGKH